MDGRVRERIDYDVLVVGAGPSGLAAAIRIKQRAVAVGRDVSVCVIEKGARVGAHLIAGAILDRRALDELFPDADARGVPLGTVVTSDEFYLLTAKRAWPLYVPSTMRNVGHRMVSLGDLARWLAAQAEALGVEIYAGFAGAEVLFGDDGEVVGVATGDRGVGRDGSMRSNYEPGMELRARQTVFAEGCRGSLSCVLFHRYQLRKGAASPTFGLGFKEVWEIDPAKAKPGRVRHSVGWPLDNATYGGGWIYHLGGNRLSIGFVVGLDYTNPHMDPFGEFQRYKTHPSVRRLLEGGRAIAFGARSIAEGGVQALPRLAFPGGVLVGDTAGFVNVPRIKGIHTAMKSGIVAADAIFEHLTRPIPGAVVEAYPSQLRESWLWDELYRVRNVRPAFKRGLLFGLTYSGFEMMISRGREPWTFRIREHDHAVLRKAADAPPIAYPKADGRVVFDRPTALRLANVAHVDDQPAHLVLKDPAAAITVNKACYASPETRFCPGGVYEIVEEATGPRLLINAVNCLHCKTCHIKDPGHNIFWNTPEGGGGPNYPGGF